MPDTRTRVSGPQYRTAEAGRAAPPHGLGTRCCSDALAQENLVGGLLETSGEGPDPMAPARHHGVAICLVA